MHTKPPAVCTRLPIFHGLGTRLVDRGRIHQTPLCSYEQLDVKCLTLNYPSMVCFSIYEQEKTYSKKCEEMCVKPLVDRSLHPVYTWIVSPILVDDVGTDYHLIVLTIT